MEEQKPKYMLMCHNCGNKHFTDGKKIDLVEVKSAPVPLRADGKINDKFANLPKRYKCPACGYLLKINKLVEAPPIEEKKKEETPRFERRTSTPFDLNPPFSPTDFKKGPPPEDLF